MTIKNSAEELELARRHLDDAEFGLVNKGLDPAILRALKNRDLNR